MKRGGTESLRSLPGVKTLVDRARRTVRVSVTPGRAGPDELRSFLYRVLNAYEKRFTVLLEGVPFCLLPDACDHIIPSTCPGRPLRLDICARCRLRSSCPGLETGSYFHSLSGTLSPVLEVPGEIVFEINRRCNLACSVCSSRRLEEELPLAMIKKQLAQARRLGIKNVRFTGGEPFLHPEILEMLSAARKLGFYTLVNTNATLLTPALIKKAAPLMDNVLISMQGWDAASDAAATGTAGLFAAKLRNIRLLRHRGVPVLRLGTIISSGLPATFSRYARLARALRADVWELYRPMLSVKPRADDPAGVTPAVFRRLAALLEREPGGSTRILFANPVPFCLFPEKQAPLFLGARFDDGHTRLVLDPRGFYKPSYYIQKNLGTDILRAWNSPFLRKLGAGEYLGRKCRRCVFSLRCLGGSRFMARARNGAYCADDPWLPAARRKSPTR